MSEVITWEKPELIDHNLFKPLKTLFSPVWPLEGEKKGKFRLKRTREVVVNQDVIRMLSVLV